MKDVFDLINEARNSISDYCINVCNSKCCRNGFLLLMGNEEVEIICGNKQVDFMKNGILSVSEMGLGFKFDLEKQGCKYLGKDFKCQIHSQLRPKVCSDYPIFKINNNLIFATDCPAVNKGLLDEYKERIEKLGIKLI